MTDRELLEFAAKAARLDYSLRDGRVSDWRPGRENVLVPWNPLDDDGDAFRLAVRLRLHAKQFPILDDGFDVPLGMVEVRRVDDDDPLHVKILQSRDDRLAATRRAIVRAAAELGRNT